MRGSKGNECIARNVHLQLPYINACLTFCSISDVIKGHSAMIPSPTTWRDSGGVEYILYFKQRLKKKSNGAKSSDLAVSSLRRLRPIHCFTKLASRKSHTRAWLWGDHYIERQIGHLKDLRFLQLCTYVGD